eukprot:4154674-Amphidinium_carterae.1
MKCGCAHAYGSGQSGYHKLCGSDPMTSPRMRFRRNQLFLEASGRVVPQALRGSAGYRLVHH